MDRYILAEWVNRVEENLPSIVLNRLVENVTIEDVKEYLDELCDRAEEADRLEGILANAKSLIGQA